jgi:hypothetical protein
VIRGRYWIGEAPKRKFSFGMLAKGCGSFSVDIFGSEAIELIFLFGDERDGNKETNL